MQLVNGHRLQTGKYRIEKMIGQGGFGITYLARWYQRIQGAIGAANSFSMVVIKEFFWSKYCNRDADGHTVSISSAEGKEMMAQFKEKLKKEGKIISRLSHPNIVGILDIFEENNTAYLVMQYVEGESLKEKIARMGKLDETTALRYAGQICSALSKIHSKRILHLDVKPSNILFDEDDNLQLIDFGISKQYDESAQETSNTPIGVSAGYSPMEQYGTLKSFSPPTDIYSAGATLYKMLTGETPIEATDRGQFDLKPVSFFSPYVSKRTEEAVTKAMSEKVRDRFQSAEEFWQALHKEDEAPANTAVDTVGNPQKDNIELKSDETIVEKEPEKIEKPEVAEKLKTAEIQKMIEKLKTVEIPEMVEKLKKLPLLKYLSVAAAILAFVLLAVFGIPKIITIQKNHIAYNNEQKHQQEIEDSISQKNALIQQQAIRDSIAREDVKKRQQTTRDSIKRVEQQDERDRIARENEQKRQQAARDSIARITQAKQQDAEKLQKEKDEQNRKDAANLLQQANSAFSNSSLGAARYEQSFQLYKKAKDMGGDASAGYSNFLSKARSLIGSGAGFDANVKIMLQYAKQLNNTQEVRDLLDKCN